MAHSTIISALLLCAVLTAGPLWAKVVDDFSDGCAPFFYNSTPPTGIDDQNLKKICQQLVVKGSRATFYATLYSPALRIPVYSAYKFNPYCSHRQDGGKHMWFLEPQLYQRNLSDAMANESEVLEEEAVPLRRVQAVNSDYSLTGYDRGQLSPSRYQCGHGARLATFALTNAAPVHPGFHRLYWSQWEEAVGQVLQNLRHGVAYLVTGTVPSAVNAIPKRTQFDDGPDSDFSRVSVPTHFWTAVCYRDRYDEQRSFSFAYIGENQPVSDIRLMSVAELNAALSDLYHSASQVQIFSAGCLDINPASESVFKQLYDSIQLPITDTLSMSDDVVNVFHTAMTTFDYHGNGNNDKRRPEVTQVTVLKSFSSLESWFRSSELMKYMFGTACMQSKPFSGPIRTLPNADPLTAQKGLNFTSTEDDTRIADKGLILTAADDDDHDHHHHHEGFAVSTEDDAETRLTLTANDEALAKQKGLALTEDDDDDALNAQTKLAPKADADAEDSLMPQKGVSVSAAAAASALSTQKSLPLSPDPDAEQLVCVLTPDQTPGCLSSCLYQEEARGYYCTSGVTRIPCSPLYSLVTVGGAQCKSGHTCGTHGYHYHWCYTDSWWDYCSPPMPVGVTRGGEYCRSNHNCGWYGFPHTWCYTDYDGSWGYCCRAQDRFSAVNGKTCEPEHPCGHYGYSYLWCRTTDGSWDYCCTQ